MKAKAVYHQEVFPEDDGSERVVHVVDHDRGGFMVSSEKVGVAIQNFLNVATSLDLHVVHGHLLSAYHIARQEEDAEYLESK
jgi:hypothetical protein